MRASAHNEYNRTHRALWTVVDAITRTWFEVFNRIMAFIHIRIIRYVAPDPGCAWCTSDKPRLRKTFQLEPVDREAVRNGDAFAWEQELSELERDALRSNSKAIIVIHKPNSHGGRYVFAVVDRWTHLEQPK